MKNEHMNDLNDVNKRGISTFHRMIDLITAILLLTEQITIIGIFLRPGRFAVSVGGPIFGGARVVAKDDLAIEQGLLDLIHITLAILLFANKITITGLFISSGEFTINVSGPIFGYPEVVPSTLMLENYKLFHSIVKEHYIVPPELLANLIRE